MRQSHRAWQTICRPGIFCSAHSYSMKAVIPATIPACRCAAFSAGKAARRKARVRASHLAPRASRLPGPRPRSGAGADAFSTFGLWGPLALINMVRYPISAFFFLQAPFFHPEFLGSLLSFIVYCFSTVGSCAPLYVHGLLVLRFFVSAVRLVDIQSGPTLWFSSCVAARLQGWDDGPCVGCECAECVR